MPPTERTPRTAGHTPPLTAPPAPSISHRRPRRIGAALPPGRAVPGRAGPGRAGPGRAGPYRAVPGRGALPARSAGGGAGQRGGGRPRQGRRGGRGSGSGAGRGGRRGGAGRARPGGRGGLAGRGEKAEGLGGERGTEWTTCSSKRFKKKTNKHTHTKELFQDYRKQQSEKHNPGCVSTATALGRDMSKARGGQDMPYSALLLNPFSAARSCWEKKKKNKPDPKSFSSPRSFLSRSPTSKSKSTDVFRVIPSEHSKLILHFYFFHSSLEVLLHCHVSEHTVTLFGFL